MDKLFFYWLTVLLITACSHSSTVPEDPLVHFRDTPQIELAISQRIDLEEYEIYRPQMAIKIDDTYLIKDNVNDCLIKALNISTGKLCKGISQGNGPQEIISMSSLQYCDTCVYVYDIMKKKIHKLLYSEKDTVITLSEHKSLTMEERPFGVTYAGNKIVASGFFHHSWIKLYGKEQTSSLPFPYFPDESLSDEEKSIVYMSTLITVKPDGKRIACATQKAGVVSIADCSTDSLKEIVRLCYFPAKVERNPSTLVTFSPEGKVGFCDITCDERHIYLLYSGRARSKHREQAFHCRHVLVYDWNGIPIKHILLKKPLFSLGYDPSSNRIYGIGYDPEGCILEYDL